MRNDWTENIMCAHNFLLSLHKRKKKTRPITAELSVRVAIIIMFPVKVEEGKNDNNLKKLNYALLVHALRCNSSGNRLKVLLSLLSSTSGISRHPSMGELILKDMSIDCCHYYIASVRKIQIVQR